MERAGRPGTADAGGSERSDAAARAVVPLLLVVFFLSGAAALVYQVVWQRMLTLHYGVGTVSITLIVTVYMVGLGIGGYAGGRWADRSARPVALYLAAELALGSFGLVSLLLLEAIGRATAGAPPAAAALASFAFLVVPTTLMGVTLPLVVKIFHDHVPHFAAAVSGLYFLNTLGAALGALLAAYGLMSFFGLDVAVAAAAATNFLLAGLILWVRRLRRVGRVGRVGAVASGPPAVVVPAAEVALGRFAYLLVLVTGYLAIGYEIVWFRIVAVLVKASPYAFATTLAVYLLGVALGSLAMARPLRRGLASPRSLFFGLQLLLGLSVAVIIVGFQQGVLRGGLSELAWSSFRFDVHPPLEVVGLRGDGPVPGTFVRWDVLLWPLLFLGVPTLFMGASFPLVTALAYERPGTEGATVGTVYFFNLLGNVLGGVVTGLVLLPWLGTERTLLMFVIVGLLAGVGVSRVGGRSVALGLRVACVAVGVVVCVLVFPRPGELYAAMHAPAFRGRVPAEAYFEEGRSGVVMTRVAWPRLENHINGMGHGVRPVYTYTREALEAIAHAPRLEKALVIGFGTGSIVETLQRSAVRRIVLVELNETLLVNLRKLPHFRAVLGDPRIELVVDDARRFLHRSDERFDLVLMDPLRTTTAYSNNLYSREFFALAKRHLAPGGVVLVWTDEFDVLPRTLARVFPHVTLYRFFLLASTEPLSLDLARWNELLSSLAPEDRAGVERVDARRLDDRDSILERTAGLPINRDRRPVSEYYLGLGARKRAAGVAGPSGS